MKRFSFLATPFLAVVFVCLVSCGDNDADDGDVVTPTADSTAGTTTVASTPASTIVTTPTNMMVVTHKVADFDKWLASYEANDSLRGANGMRSYVIGRGVQDPNTVLVALKVDDMNQGKAFGKSAALKQAMKKGGVVGTPVMQYSIMTFQDTGIIETDMRSRATFSVKEWARWQRAFDSSQKTGYDNGLKVRSYGHDADDDKKVTVVTAIIDSAKAQAYWKSDMLKQRQAASGVNSKLDRFIFRVVKRY